MKGRFLAIALAIVILLPGCYEILSWSSDGRYLAFVKPRQGLWLWDTETQTPRQLLGNTRVLDCKYLPSGKSILVDLHNSENDNTETDVYRLTLKSGELELLVPECVQYLYDVSPDGRYLYYLAPDGEEEDGVELWKLNLRYPKLRRLLLRTFIQPYMLRVGPSGKRLLFYANAYDREAVCMFELPGKNVRKAFAKVLETRILVDGDEEAWPTWIDEDRFAYVKDCEGESGATKGLFVYSLPDGVSRKLVEHVEPPGAALSPDAKRLAVTVSWPIGDTGNGVAAPSATQIAVVDIATGEAHVVTDEPMGAAYATFSPKRNRIAYLTPPDIEDPTLVRILDLDTGEITTVWHNEAERLLARAESARAHIDTPAALETYQAFLDANPDSNFAPLAAYRIGILRAGDAPVSSDE